MRCSAEQRRSYAICASLIALRSGAPLIRDRHGSERSRVCSAPLRAALRPGHETEESRRQWPPSARRHWIASTSRFSRRCSATDARPSRNWRRRSGCRRGRRSNGCGAWKRRASSPDIRPWSSSVPAVASGQRLRRNHPGEAGQSRPVREAARRDRRRRRVLGGQRHRRLHGALRLRGSRGLRGAHQRVDRR